MLINDKPKIYSMKLLDSSKGKEVTTTLIMVILPNMLIGNSGG